MSYGRGHLCPQLKDTRTSDELSTILGHCRPRCKRLSRNARGGGLDPRRASQILEKAANATPAVSVRINSVTSAGRVLRARIESDGNSEAREADVYVAIALNHAESHVSAGENSGRRLTHVAVVEYLKKIGKIEPGKTFAEDFQTKLKAATDPGNLRIVAFVQEPGPGKVLGAALKIGPFDN